MKHLNYKRNWLFLLFCSINIFLTAQADLVQKNLTINKVISKEYGLNAAFINNFIFRENSTVFEDRYMFYTRRYLAGNKYQRQGFNIHIAGRIEKVEGTPEKTTHEFGLDYRLGWGIHKKVLKNTTLFWGTDWLIEPAFKTIKVGSSNPRRDNANKTTNNSLAMGIGPFIGVQYNFTKRFGLFTEANFYWYISYETDKINFNNSLREDVLNREFRYFFSDRPLAGIVLFYKL